MGGEVEILRSHRRNSDAVDKRAVRCHPPALQHAVLAAFQLPPAGRIKPALIAEISGAGPDPKLPAVDRDSDVRRPVRGGPRDFRRKFERQVERRNGLADVPDVVRELILDEAAREPHEPRIHSVGIEESPGHIEQTNDPFWRTEAARRADFAAGVEPNRHCNFDRVGADAADIVAEHHQHFVEGGKAELLTASAALLRFSPNEAGGFENLQIGRDGRLRKTKRPGDIVHVEAGATVEETQDSRPRRRGQAVQDVWPLRGIDHQEIARHSPPARTLGVRISFSGGLLISAHVDFSHQSHLGASSGC